MQHVINLNINNTWPVFSEFSLSSAVSLDTHDIIYPVEVGTGARTSVNIASAYSRRDPWNPRDWKDVLATIERIIRIGFECITTFVSEIFIYNPELSRNYLDTANVHQEMRNKIEKKNNKTHWAINSWRIYSPSLIGFALKKILKVTNMPVHRSVVLSILFLYRRRKKKSIYMNLLFMNSNDVENWAKLQNR